MRSPRRVLVSGVVAVALFAGVAGTCERTLPKHQIQEAIIRVAVAAGCQYYSLSGRRLIGPDGPAGQGPGLKWFNLAWIYLPIVIPYLAGFAVALSAYHLSIRQRTPCDGFTRCGPCGHILKGLSEPRCPECGVRI